MRDRRVGEDAMAQIHNVRPVGEGRADIVHRLFDGLPACDQRQRIESTKTKTAKGGGKPGPKMRVISTTVKL